MTATFSYGLEKLEPAFEDRPVPYIAFGGRFADLTATQLVQTFGAKRVFIICSTSLAGKTDNLKKLQTAIANTDAKLVGTHVGIAPHTPWSEVVSITNKIRDAFKDSSVTDHDVLVTLGGGSITDGTKVIAWALAQDPAITTVEDLEQLYSGRRGFVVENTKKPAVRVITIPTTLSGGEYQSIAGVTRPPPSNQKCLFTPPARNPSLVILDPELVLTTPMSIWLSTGVRAIDHCVETLCSVHSNEKGDEAAKSGLRLIVSSLIRTKQNSADLQARFDSMMSVRDAMHAVGSGVALGGSHAIGHQLGPLGVGHGETSCINLPAVCEYNLKHGGKDVQARQQACLDIMMSINEVKQLMHGTEKPSLGDTVDAVVRKLEMPRTLKEVKVGRDKLDALAENTLTDPWAPTNPVPLTTKEQVLEILEMVVG